MANLNIQIQKKWNDSIVKQVLLILWSDKSIRKIHISRGNDKGAYINFNVECRSGASLWNKIGKRLNKLPKFKSKSIVITTGKNGWNDYKLIQSGYE